MKRMIAAIAVIVVASFTAGQASFALAQTHSTRNDFPDDIPFQRLEPARRDLGAATAPRKSDRPISLGTRSAVAAPVTGVFSDETQAADFPEEQSVHSKDLAPVVNKASPHAVKQKTVYRDDDPVTLTAHLRVLNKVTAKFDDIVIPVGEEVAFARLLIRAVSCKSTLKVEPQDYAGLFSVSELQTAPHGQEHALPTQIFSGWMFASSPSLHGVEHPVYDISLMGCISREDITDPAHAKNVPDAEKKIKKQG